TLWAGSTPKNSSVSTGWRYSSRARFPSLRQLPATTSARLGASLRAWVAVPGGVAASTSCAVEGSPSGAAVSWAQPSSIGRSSAGSSVFISSRRFTERREPNARKPLDNARVYWLSNTHGRRDASHPAGGPGADLPPDHGPGAPARRGWAAVGRRRTALGARGRRGARDQPDDRLQGLQPAGNRGLARAPAREGHGGGAAGHQLRGGRPLGTHRAVAGRRGAPGGGTGTGRRGGPGPAAADDGTGRGKPMNATIADFHEAAVAAPADLAGEAGIPLSARALEKHYGGHAALDGVSLELQPGAVLGVIGWDGGGKSRLSRTLLGLRGPDSGEARIWGRPALAMGDAGKQRLGYVPQQREALSWLK